jgi:hypothetical protein
VKRIKELEKKVCSEIIVNALLILCEKVAELENRRGSGIEALISAVHPDNETVTNLKNALATQVFVVSVINLFVFNSFFQSAAHAAREAELDKGFRALRQEHDR